MPALTPKIRLAVPGDETVLAALCRAVHELHAAARPDVFLPYAAAAFQAWFGELLAGEEVKLWIAEIEGVPAGYVSAARKTREANAFCHARVWCEIDNMAVEPEFRNRGLARQLMETAIAHARAEGIQEFELTTWSFNQDALAAFESLGFRPRVVRLELRN